MIRFGMDDLQTIYGYAGVVTVSFKRLTVGSAGVNLVHAVGFGSDVNSL